MISNHNASGTINCTGNTTTGIQITSGVVTLGIPEEPGSINYGRAEADVSTTNPLIEAIGTNTGIGVKNAGGRFKYFDGKLVATTDPKPEVPTEVEYLYEPKDFVDEVTGYKYTILKWMREQNNG